MEKYFISIPNEGISEYIGPEFYGQMLLVHYDDGRSELLIKLTDDFGDLPTVCVVFLNDNYTQKCYITEDEFNDACKGYKRVYLNCFEGFERLCDNYMDTKLHDYPLTNLLVNMANWITGFDEDQWDNPFE